MHRSTVVLFSDSLSFSGSGRVRFAKANTTAPSSTTKGEHAALDPRMRLMIPCIDRPFTSFKFTIHGLWPNYNDGSYPQFCDPSYDFNEDALRDLYPDLRDEWQVVCFSHA